MDNSAHYLKIPIKIKNCGKHVLKSQMPHPIHISYHLLDENRNIILFDGVRTELDNPIFPDDCVEEICIVKDIPADCKYVQITLVQEGICWFNDICESGAMTVKLVR